MQELRLEPLNSGRPRSSLTIRDWVALGFRHGRLMVLSFLAIFLSVAVITWLTPARYEAEMKILVKRERFDPGITGDVQPRLGCHVLGVRSHQGPQVPQHPWLDVAIQDAEGVLVTCPRAPDRGGEVWWSRPEAFSRGQGAGCCPVHPENPDVHRRPPHGDDDLSRKVITVPVTR